MPPTFPASCTAGGNCVATVPDVCLTPAPPAPSPVPMPYPNMGNVMQATKTAKKVKIVGKPAVTMKSEIPRSMGDEAGVNKGVASGFNMGKILYKKCSMAVKIEGQPTAYYTSMTSHNGPSGNCIGSQVVPSQAKVLIAP